MNIFWRNKTTGLQSKQVKAVDKLFDSTSKLTSTLLATKTIVATVEIQSDTTSTIREVVTQSIILFGNPGLVLTSPTNGVTIETTIFSVTIGSDKPEISTSSTSFNPSTSILNDLAPTMQPTNNLQSGLRTQVIPTVSPNNSPDGTASSRGPPSTSHTNVAESSGEPSSPTLVTNTSNQQSARKSMVTPIVATVVPLLILLVCLTLYLCWKRRKNLCQKEQDDLERETVWVNSPDKVSGVTEGGKRHEKPDNNFSDAPRIHKKPRPHPISMPPKDQALQDKISPILKKNPDQEDPFLTPTGQTTFSDTNTQLGSEEFRESRIGLAVTTPVNKNASTTSLVDSLRSVIHHTSRRLSNPFRDPITSIFNAVGDTDQNSAARNNHNGDGSSSGSDSQSKSKSSDNKSHQAVLTKSDTPPEELARRWIKVLKMEAAQAQEAAVEAARQAEELKRRNGVNDENHRAN